MKNVSPRRVMRGSSTPNSSYSLAGSKRAPSMASIERPSRLCTTRRCERKLSRTSPVSLSLTTRTSTGSLADSRTQSITTSLTPMSQRGKATNPGFRAVGRSATRTSSTTPSPVATAAGLNAPMTSQSLREGGRSPGRSKHALNKRGIAFMIAGSTRFRPAHELVDHAVGGGVIRKHHRQFAGARRRLTGPAHLRLHRTTTGAVDKSEFPLLAVRPQITHGRAQIAQRHVQDGGGAARAIQHERLSQAVIHHEGEALLGRGTALARLDPCLPEDFARAPENERTEAGLLHAEVHRHVQLAGGGWFAISIQNSEGASAAVFGFMAALDFLQRVFDAWHLGAKIEFDRYHQCFGDFRRRQRRVGGRAGGRGSVRWDGDVRSGRAGRALGRPHQEGGDQPDTHDQTSPYPAGSPRGLVARRRGCSGMLTLLLLAHAIQPPWLTSAESERQNRGRLTCGPNRCTKSLSFTT